MDEKQFKQTNDNLKSKLPESVESIGDILTSQLSDKCEQCGLRPKHVEFAAGKADTKKWCRFCIDIYQRKQKLVPSKAIAELALHVGDAYLDAYLEDVEIAEELLAAGGDVFLWGDVGVGKTWAMAALLRHYLCEGYTCARVNFDDFCCRVRATMSNHSPKTEYDLIQSLVKVDKLFIDDIGLRSKAETDFAYVTFYSIINKRQERRLPTYISTNKNIDQLALSFDKRIASRLGMGAVIEMTGTDRRKDN